MLALASTPQRSRQDMSWPVERDLRQHNYKRGWLVFIVNPRSTERPECRCGTPPLLDADTGEETSSKGMPVALHDN